MFMMRTPFPPQLLAQLLREVIHRILVSLWEGPISFFYGSANTHSFCFVQRPSSFNHFKAGEELIFELLISALQRMTLLRSDPTSMAVMIFLMVALPLQGRSLQDYLFLHH